MTSPNRAGVCANRRCSGLQRPLGSSADWRFGATVVLASTLDVRADAPVIHRRVLLTATGRSIGIAHCPYGRKLLLMAVLRRRALCRSMAGEPLLARGRSSGAGYRVTADGPVQTVRHARPPRAHAVGYVKRVGPGFPERNEIRPLGSPGRLSRWKGPACQPVPCRLQSTASRPRSRASDWAEPAVSGEGSSSEIVWLSGSPGGASARRGGDGRGNAKDVTDCSDTAHQTV